jgi:hypothetical protein
VKITTYNECDGIYLYIIVFLTLETIVIVADSTPSPLNDFSGYWKWHIEHKKFIKAFKKSLKNRNREMRQKWIPIAYFL